MIQELEPRFVNCELVQHPESLAMVTTTFYKQWFDGDSDVTNTDKIRGDLALRTIQKAANLGHQVVVVDGSPAESPFYSAVRKFIEIKVVNEDKEHQGMDPSRQYGFELASRLSGVKVIAWIEPEKESMATRGCLWPAVLAVLDGTYDLVIPARDTEAFATYPPYQTDYEKRANTRFNSILRMSGLLKPDDIDLDAWFGPRVFSKALLPYFMGRYDFRKDVKSEAIVELYKHIKPGNYNSATFFPIIRALSDDKKVGNLIIPYRHPKTQTESETNDPIMQEKRHAQYMNIVTACLHYVRYLTEERIPTNNPKSRIIPH